MNTAPAPCGLLSFSGTSSPVSERLYCFPYAGGSSSVFASWGRLLAPQLRVIGVDLPGHGSRFKDQPLGSVAGMADSAAEAIRNSESNFPRSGTGFAFYGHSLGAVIAYETARLLEDRFQAAPSHLFVGAARAPGLPPPLPPISHLDDTAFLDKVHGRYGGLPAILFEEPELLALVLPVLRADFKAYEIYSSPADPLLSQPVTAFVGEHDPVVDGTAMKPWSRATSNRFDLHVLSGGHFFLNDCRSQLLKLILNTVAGATVCRTS